MICVEIAGAVTTESTASEWLDDFIMWLESRGESFGGATYEAEE